MRRGVISVYKGVRQTASSRETPTPAWCLIATRVNYADVVDETTIEVEKNWPEKIIRQFLDKEIRS